MTVRRVLVGGGVAIMAYAVAGAILSREVKLIGVAIFLAAALVLHDGIFLPAVHGLDALITRFVPARVQQLVRHAGIVSLAVLVVAAPLGVGGDHPYAWGEILIGVWGAGLVIRKGLARWRRRSSR